MKSKKAAFEMSIGTMVIIVIAITMLILGLVLVRNIFRGATESISVLDENTRTAISSLFTDETEDIMIKLGADNTARIRPTGETFRIAIGARTFDGDNADRERMKIKLTLQPATGENCMSVLGEQQTKSLFKNPQIDAEDNFLMISGDQVFTDVEISIPKGTAQCSQRVLVDVTDTNTGNSVGSYFNVEVLRRYF